MEVINRDKRKETADLAEDPVILHLKKRLQSMKSQSSVSVTGDGTLTVDDIRLMVRKYWKLIPIEERINLAITTLQEFVSTYNKVSSLLGLGHSQSKSRSKSGSWMDRVIDIILAIMERGMTSAQDKEKLASQLRNELEKVLAEEEGK